MDKNIEKQIRELAAGLEPEEGQAFAVKLPNGKGLFVAYDFLVNKAFEEVPVYFIELDNIIVDDEWEPCGKFNASSPFGDVDELVKTIKWYLDWHGIEV